MAGLLGTGLYSRTSMNNKQQESTRQRILIIAGQVFAAKGYEAATLREICQQAGANMAAVGYYFRGKERLYEESVRYAANSLADELPRWPSGTPAVDQLRTLVHAVVSMATAGRCAPWRLRLVLREVLHPRDSCQGAAHEAIRPFFESLVSVLDGLLPAEVSRTRKPLIAFSVLCQCLHHHLAEAVLSLCAEENKEPRCDVRGLAEHIVEFSLAALGLSSDCKKRPRQPRDAFCPRMTNTESAMKEEPR